MIISSKDNEIIKEIRKLKEKKYRKEKFIVEGIKMLEEAINENASIDLIIIREGINLDLDISEFKSIVVTEKVFNTLTDVVSPQGVLAVINKKSAENTNNENIKSIDTKNMTAEQVFEYGKERGSEFYSPYISDVDYLDKNHYIVHSGGISYKNGKIQNQPAGIASSDTLVSDTAELLDGKVIFEMVLPTNNYRVEKMSLYDGKFSLGKAKHLGSLGLTDLDDQKFSFMLNGKSIDEDYKKHNIKITKEKDRLVVTGTFKKGTPVNIILYKDMMENIYSMRVSKTPYTALCVDLGNNSDDEENITATKYINKDGLIGKYTIFIEIDGTFYNTNDYVDF